MEEEFEIDPQELLLENALRVVFRAAEMLDAEKLTPDELKALSGALRDATEVVLSIEGSCSCGDGEEAQG